MPFVTAGDPDLKATQAAIRALGSAGVSLIEIGFPYSDPIADGPVIQASYTRALEKQTRVRAIFDALGELKDDSLPPLVAMVSYAIVMRIGSAQFLDQCCEAGLAGLIVPDLPGAEAQDLFDLCRSRGLDLVQLIAPTTPRARVKQILNCCSGFVYCVAVAGTTGERDQVAATLLEQLRWLREETELPLAVGFGISRPDHVEPLRGLADGVIVGTAIVRQFEKIGDGASQDDVMNEIADFARSMVEATSRSPGK